jgi:hypothetical protein
MRQLSRNCQQNLAAWLLTCVNRRGAPGGKLKMTLGLPVYVRSRSCPPEDRSSTDRPGPILRISRELRAWTLTEGQRCHHELR